MNGLANAILTLLLSWLRIIINRFWSLISSETGTSFYTFLANHWLTILLVLLVGGFVVDRIIYFIRWRPFRVWLRRRGYGKAKQAEAEPPQQPFEPAASAVAQQPVLQPVMQEETGWPAGDTNFYHPASSVQPAQTAIYPRQQVDRAAYMPPISNVEPVFDEEATLWAEADPLVVDPQPTRLQPPVSMQAAQADFIQPAPQEQPYTSFQEESTYVPDPEELYLPDGQPVHPGLATDVLRRNMGLHHNDEATEPYTGSDVTYEPAGGSPSPIAFTPFTMQAEKQTQPKKKRNPFKSLMQLMGEESTRPSIRDLQSTVDVRTAFHEPVFPQQNHSEEDE